MRRKRIAKRDCKRSLRYEALEDRRVLATLIVNVAPDYALIGGEGNDNGELTLREPGCPGS